MSKKKHYKYYPAENNKGNYTFVVVIIVTVIVLIGFFGSGSTTTGPVNGATKDTVTTTGDKQIVTVDVNGGYSPGSITAKAGVPTILKMRSINASGCERAFRIPSLKISKTLPSSGDTDIDIGSQTAGTKLRGTCSMGMYNFTVNFN